MRANRNAFICPIRNLLLLESLQKCLHRDTSRFLGFHQEITKMRKLMKESKEEILPRIGKLWPIYHPWLSRSLEVRMKHLQPLLWDMDHSIRGRKGKRWRFFRNLILYWRRHRQKHPKPRFHPCNFFVENPEEVVEILRNLSGDMGCMSESEWGHGRVGLISKVHIVFFDYLTNKSIIDFLSSII